MRILIDVQTLYTAEKNRGIGIYTYNWVRGLINQDSSHRYYLLRKKNDEWQFTFVSKFIDFDQRVQEDHTWETADIEDFIEQKNIDIIHFTSPLMFDIEVPNIKNQNVKVSYLVYDLIPIVMKEHYYNKWPQHIQNLYDSRCNIIKKADCILTISEASKNDLIRIYKIDSNKIHVVYASTNEYLYQEERSGKEQTLLKEELNLSSRFIFSLTGYDPRKNNKGLINAFSKLNKEFSDVILVISGIKQENEREELSLHAKEKGINPSQLLFLGFITDDCLVALYKECEMFVFPSVYEGFGLPVLEAMRCGTPVITTNSSSLTEVAEAAAIIVDVNEDEILAKAITSLLKDKQLSDVYKTKGIKQAEKFSWNKTTSASLLVIKNLIFGVSPEIQFNSNKPVLAYFSPLNPQSSGISDYSEELLVNLKDFFEIKIFVDNFSPDNPFIRSNFEVLEYKTNMELLERISTRVYHMGNNELHSWIYDAFIDYPGSVVLHDLNLYGFYMYTKYLRGDKHGFVNELTYSHGQQGNDAGMQLITQGSYPNDQEFPMFKKVVELSNQIIVHSKWVKEKIQIETNFTGEIINIPSGIIIEKEEYNKDDLKKRLNINPDKITIGVFGNVIPNKRVDVILRVISELVKTNTNIQLYIVGHCSDDVKAQLTKIMRQLNVNNFVKLIDSPDLELFKSYIKASDICINLRWPTFGETSATLVRSLGYGVPCIVSNVGSYKEYPDDCVWKVDVDEYEEELVLAYLLELTNNKLLLNSMSAISTCYAEKTLDFLAISNKYFNTLTSHLNEL
ncbi:glycosyltransferase [Paenibacillus sp. FSL H7-0331]|uniref:glycosyltransferase n=1 Tax=Paenibacillus sp. FSL H7-0331 TaxID=1920421 RepID=UPI00096CD75E|nr:glycosyltransferase [Paenibacillus sp. FSL H7-0331]OMF08593.1 hypothetical protein BK127_28400 [Paenibacillus sp. FSL H7-0331]